MNLNMKNIAIAFLVLGMLITMFAGYNFSTQDKVVEIGNLEITKKKNHVMQWSLAIGVVVMLIGGGLLFYSNNKKNI
jgi:hypothetical protein